MMTRRKLIIKKLRQAAKQRGLDFYLLRQGSRHEVYCLDGLRIPIPRHNEVSERTTLDIINESEQKLGKGVVAMSNYDVLVQPDGRYWYVQVPAIERSTQAKGLDDIEPMAKDLITVMNDDDNPELKVTFVLPKQAKQHVTEMFRQREIAKKANAQAAAESRLAARALRNEGLTYRQIGALLGVSYQRAFQLVNGKTKHKTTASESPQPTTESRSPRTHHATPLSTPVSA